MIRKIIKIDEDKCNGCGACTTICAEAALEIVNGKAKLVKDFLCDGMGACLDVCPVDALHVVEEETEGYDAKKAYEHVARTRGEESAKKVHGYDSINPDSSAKHQEPMMCGCPGSMMQDFRTDVPADCCDEGSKKQESNLQSELRQWPTQLHLVSPMAPYFSNCDLVVSADCAPFAFANFHSKFLKGRSLAMFCPKLDDGQDVYVEKLATMFASQNVKSITVVRMEVSCCGGVEQIVRDAQQRAGTNIPVAVNVISVQGVIS